MPSSPPTTEKNVSEDDGQYRVDRSIVAFSNQRKIKVLTIGSGYSGILMAYLIQKQCTNVEHVIYEKNHDIGGTWLENRYPGCGCDVPSHTYIFNFAPYVCWQIFPKVLKRAYIIYIYILFVKAH